MSVSEASGGVMADIAEPLSILEEDGIVTLPLLLSDPELKSMQHAFGKELLHPRWNTTSGYQQNEKWRLLVEDVLALDSGFVTLAIHPLIQEILGHYIGADYILSEARGWETIATKHHFHGWHSDAWYDNAKVDKPPRELKVGYYLTDVEEGYFEYIRGSHKLGESPRMWADNEIVGLPNDIIKVRGNAGTAFIFDTAGVHRQSSPVCPARRALLYTYHDPGIPIQEMDLKSGRYHSLLLRAAFLGSLSEEDRRVLGFGNMCYVDPSIKLHQRYPTMHSVIAKAMHLRLEWQYIYSEFQGVLKGILRRLLL